MNVSRIRMTVTVLAVLGAAGWLTRAVPTRAQGTAAGISDTDYAQLYKQLYVKNQPWTRIPWKVSLTEARRLAAEEHKPIFLNVNTGNALCWT